MLLHVLSAAPARFEERNVVPSVLADSAQSAENDACIWLPYQVWFSV